MDDKKGGGAVHPSKPYLRVSSVLRNHVSTNSNTVRPYALASGAVGNMKPQYFWVPRQLSLPMAVVARWFGRNAAYKRRMKS